MEGIRDTERMSTVDGGTFYNGAGDINASGDLTYNDI